MAQDFPLCLQQLLPIMDVIGYANKYLKRVRSCRGAVSGNQQCSS